MVSVNDSPTEMEILITADISIRPVHINALLNFLDGHQPGTALIGVAKLGNPKLKFEIEAIAALKFATGPQAADLA